MALHNELGQKAEELAFRWLKENGYDILHRNWRYRQYEIDMIAMKNGFLTFIEVKARHSTRYGYPEESVGKRKFRNLQRAADEYMFQHPGYKWIRFAILAITLPRNGKPDFFLLDDVFL